MDNKTPNSGSMPLQPNILRGSPNLADSEDITSPIKDNPNYMDSKVQETSSIGIPDRKIEHTPASSSSKESPADIAELLRKEKEFQNNVNEKQVMMGCLSQIKPLLTDLDNLKTNLKELREDFGFTITFKYSGKDGKEVSIIPPDDSLDREELLNLLGKLGIQVDQMDKAFKNDALSELSEKIQKDIELTTQELTELGEYSEELDHQPTIRSKIEISTFLPPYPTRFSTQPESNNFNLPVNQNGSFSVHVSNNKKHITNSSLLSGNPPQKEERLEEKSSQIKRKTHRKGINTHASSGSDTTLSYHSDSLPTTSDENNDDDTPSEQNNSHPYDRNVSDPFLKAEQFTGNQYNEEAINSNTLSSEPSHEEAPSTKAADYWNAPESRLNIWKAKRNNLEDIKRRKERVYDMPRFSGSAWIGKQTETHRQPSDDLRDSFDPPSSSKTPAASYRSETFIKLSPGNHDLGNTTIPCNTLNSSLNSGKPALLSTSIPSKPIITHVLSSQSTKQKKPDDPRVSETQKEKKPLQSPSSLISPSIKDQSIPLGEKTALNSSATNYWDEPDSKELPDSWTEKLDSWIEKRKSLKHIQKQRERVNGTQVFSNSAWIGKQTKTSPQPRDDLRGSFDPQSSSKAHGADKQFLEVGHFTGSDYFTGDDCDEETTNSTTPGSDPRHKDILKNLKKSTSSKSNNAFNRPETSLSNTTIPCNTLNSSLNSGKPALLSTSIPSKPLITHVLSSQSTKQKKPDDPRVSETQKEKKPLQSPSSSISPSITDQSVPLGEKPALNSSATNYWDEPDSKELPDSWTEKLDSWVEKRKSLKHIQKQRERVNGSQVFSSSAWVGKQTETSPQPRDDLRGSFDPQSETSLSDPILTDDQSLNKGQISRPRRMIKSSNDESTLSLPPTTSNIDVKHEISTSQPKAPKTKKTDNLNNSIESITTNKTTQQTEHNTPAPPPPPPPPPPPATGSSTKQKETISTKLYGLQTRLNESDTDMSIAISKMIDEKWSKPTKVIMQPSKKQMNDIPFIDKNIMRMLSIETNPAVGKKLTASSIIDAINKADKEIISKNLARVLLQIKILEKDQIEDLRKLKNINSDQNNTIQIATQISEIDNIKDKLNLIIKIHDYEDNRDKIKENLNTMISFLKDIMNNNNIPAFIDFLINVTSSQTKVANRLDNTFNLIAAQLGHKRQDMSVADQMLPLVERCVGGEAKLEELKHTTQALPSAETAVRTDPAKFGLIISQLSDMKQNLEKAQKFITPDIIKDKIARIKEEIEMFSHQLSEIKELSTKIKEEFRFKRKPLKKSISIMSKIDLEQLEFDELSELVNGMNTIKQVMSTAFSIFEKNKQLEKEKKCKENMFKTRKNKAKKGNLDTRNELDEVLLKKVLSESQPPNRTRRTRKANTTLSKIDEQRELKK